MLLIGGKKGFLANRGWCKKNRRYNSHSDSNGSDSGNGLSVSNCNWTPLLVATANLAGFSVQAMECQFTRYSRTGMLH
jgi:hypothetical protein